ncbi:MAG: sulfatase [Verrucomicrobiota bacterium]
MNQRFKTFIGSALSCLLIGVAFGQPARAADASRPNVLFIIVDDLRTELGCYGNKLIQTPNIDRLAAEGMRFERNYCQVPVCGASRASFLTGLPPTRSRFLDAVVEVDKDAPGVVTLPQHFKNQGYTTIGIGKIFHLVADSHQSWSEPAWRPNSLPKDDWRNYLNPENIALKNKNNLNGPAFERADVPDNAYYDGQFADRAIARLKKLKEEPKPFFLALGLLKPHLPFNAPSKYWDLYPTNKISLAANPFRSYGAPDAAFHQWSELRSYLGIPKQGSLSEETARNLVHGYYAAASYTDALVGKVLAGLDQLGLRKNTIVVLVGDNGYLLGEHGMWTKHCNFEAALRVPLLISAPGLPAGEKSDSLVQSMDIYPTLCELCNLPPPATLAGTSLVPVLRQPSEQPHQAVFSRWHDSDSVRTERFRYTEWTGKNGRITARMLYDHQQDSAENQNIAEQPEFAATVKELSALLKTFREPRADFPVPGGQ